MIKQFLTITPLGGLGEIGLNCQLWETPEGVIIIDYGLMFPSDQQLGIDLIIPPLEPILNVKDYILGVILTHGHEDHIGAIPWLVNTIEDLHIYGSPFTLALLEHKLKEHNIYDKAKLITVTPKTKLSLGSLSFQFIPVNHSIPQGYALAVTSPVGKIVHSGDFKIDLSPTNGIGTDIASLKKFAGSKGIRLLLSDSTNADLEGHTHSEQCVTDSFYNIFKEATGRIIITLFSSHIERIQNICNIVQHFNKTLIISGRNLINNIEKARELGFLHINCAFYTDQNLPELLPEQTVIIATGSQGEPLSALMRIASGDHRCLTIQKGDTMIMSSRAIPGNTLSVNRLINQLYRLGAKVYLDGTQQKVHVSGHAYKEELATLIKTVKPQYFIPIHGEYRQLAKHKEIAIEYGISEDNIFILEDGMPITLQPESIHLKEALEIQPVFIDGKGVGDVDNLVLMERQILADDGVVIISFSRNQQTGYITQGPLLISRGFIFKQHIDYLSDETKDILVNILDAEPLIDEQTLEKKLCSSLKSFFRKTIGREPIIIPVIN